MKKNIVYSLIIALVSPWLSFTWASTTYPAALPASDHPLLAIDIPSEIGKIVAQQVYSRHGKTIIHIQDLHCNYDVQKNIAAIIAYLVTHHQVSMIGLEGAWQPIDVSSLRDFDLKWARRMISDYLVKIGKYTGAEDYAINSANAIQLTGIEEQELYLKSLQLVNQFLNHEVLGTVIDLQELLLATKTRCDNQSDLDKLAHYSRSMEIIEKLVNISALPAEITLINNKPETLSLMPILELIERYHAGMTPAIKAECLKLEQPIQQALQFYQLADARSHTAVTKLARTMQASGQQTAIMITGGYHSPEIIQTIQHQKINYISIRPALGQSTTANPYFDILQGKHSAAEKLLLTARAGLAPLIQSPQRTGSQQVTMSNQPAEVQQTYNVVEKLKQLTRQIDQLQPGRNTATVQWSADHRRAFLKNDKLSIILSRSPLNKITCEAIMKANGWHIGMTSQANQAQLLEFIHQPVQPWLLLVKLFHFPWNVVKQLWPYLDWALQLVTSWFQLPPNPPAALATAAGPSISATASRELKQESQVAMMSQSSGPNNDSTSSQAGPPANPDPDKIVITDHRQSSSTRLERQLPFDHAEFSHTELPAELNNFTDELLLVGRLVLNALNFPSTGAVTVNRNRFLSQTKRMMRYFLINMKKKSYLIFGSDQRKFRNGSLFQGTFFRGAAGKVKHDMLLLLSEGLATQRPIGNLMAFVITPKSTKAVFKALPDFRLFKIVMHPMIQISHLKEILNKSQLQGQVKVEQLVKNLWSQLQQQNIDHPNIAILYRPHHEALIRAFASEMGMTLSDFPSYEQALKEQGALELSGEHGTLLLRYQDDWSPALNFKGLGMDAPHLIIGEGGMPQALLSAVIAQKQSTDVTPPTMVALPVPPNHHHFSEAELKTLDSYHIEPGVVFDQHELIAKTDADQTICLIGFYQSLKIAGQFFSHPRVVLNERIKKIRVNLALLTDQGLQPIKLFFATRPETTLPSPEPVQVERLNEVLNQIRLYHWAQAQALSDRYFTVQLKTALHYYIAGRKKLIAPQTSELSCAQLAFADFESAWQVLRTLIDQNPENQAASDLNKLIAQELLELSLYLKEENLAADRYDEAVKYSIKTITFGQYNGTFDLWGNHVRLLLRPWLNQYETFLLDAEQAVTQEEKVKFLYHLFLTNQQAIMTRLTSHQLGDSSPLSAWQFLLYTTIFDDYTLKQQALLLEKWHREQTENTSNYVDWTLNLITSMFLDFEQLEGLSDDIVEWESEQGLRQIPMNANGLRSAASDYARDGESINKADIAHDANAQLYYKTHHKLTEAQAQILLGLGLKAPAQLYFNRWKALLKPGTYAAIQSSPGISSARELLNLANAYYQSYLAFGDERDRQAANEIYAHTDSFNDLAAYVIELAGPDEIYSQTSFGTHGTGVNGYAAFISHVSVEDTPKAHFRPSEWRRRKDVLARAPIDALNPHQALLADLREFQALQASLPVRANAMTRGLALFFDFIDPQKWTSFSDSPPYQTFLQTLYQTWQSASYVEQQALGWALRFNDIGFYLDPAAHGHEDRSVQLIKEIFKRYHVLPEVVDLTLRLIRMQSLLGQARLGEIRYETLHHALTQNRLKFGLVQIMHAMEVAGRKGSGNALSLNELANIVHYHHQAPAVHQAFLGYRFQSFSSRKWDFDPEQSYAEQENRWFTAMADEAAVLTTELNSIDMVDHIRHLSLDLHDRDSDTPLMLLKLLAQLSRAFKKTDSYLDGQALTFHSDLGNLLHHGQLPSSVVETCHNFLQKHHSLSLSQIIGELKKTKSTRLFGLPIYRDGNHVWVRFSLLNHQASGILRNNYRITNQPFYKNVKRVNKVRAKRMQQAWELFAALRQHDLRQLPQAVQAPMQALMQPYHATATIHEQQGLSLAVALHDCGYGQLPKTIQLNEKNQKPLHEIRGHHMARFYLNKQGAISESAKKLAIVLTRYHSYLGQTRLGERRESIFLSKPLFEANIPLWMLQLLNAIDVLAQMDTLGQAAVIEQLQKIRDYPELAAEMATHYDDYRLQTMARPSIHGQSLSDGSQDEHENQVTALKKSFSALCAMEEHRLRSILNNNLDLLSNVVHLSHALAAQDQTNFKPYVKWMKFLAQLAAVVAEREQQTDIDIRTDIQTIESSELSLNQIVSMVTPKLIELLDTIPDDCTIETIKQKLTENQDSLFGLPLAISNQHITIKISQLIASSDHDSGSNPPSSSMLNSHYWTTMLGLLLGAQVLDLGLVPHLFFGTGFMILTANQLWQQQQKLFHRFLSPASPRRPYRLRRSLLSAA